MPISSDDHDGGDGGRRPVPRLLLWAAGIVGGGLLVALAALWVVPASTPAVPAVAGAAGAPAGAAAPAIGAPPNPAPLQSPVQLVSTETAIDLANRADRADAEARTAAENARRAQAAATEAATALENARHALDTARTANRPDAPASAFTVPQRAFDTAAKTSTAAADRAARSSRESGDARQRADRARSEAVRAWKPILDRRLAEKNDAQRMVRADADRAGETAARDKKSADAAVSAYRSAAPRDKKKLADDAKRALTTATTSNAAAQSALRSIRSAQKALDTALADLRAGLPPRAERTALSASLKRATTASKHSRLHESRTGPGHGRQAGRSSPRHDHDAQNGHARPSGTAARHAPQKGTPRGHGTPKNSPRVHHAARGHDSGKHSRGVGRTHSGSHAHHGHSTGHHGNGDRGHGGRSASSGGSSSGGSGHSARG